MAKVYYVGDWAVLTGPWFAESPFQNAMKPAICRAASFGSG